jgi:hypothetical protein
MSDQEVGRCGFCQKEKPVNRLYLYPSLYKKPEDISERKALHNEGDYFIILYFCSECGIPGTPDLLRDNDIKSYTPNGDQSWFPKINPNINKPLHRSIIIRLRMWWARYFQVISEKQAKAWGLKEDHKVSGDCHNEYYDDPHSSVWIDEKGREYLIK